MLQRKGEKPETNSGMKRAGVVAIIRKGGKVLGDDVSLKDFSQRPPLRQLFRVALSSVMGYVPWQMENLEGHRLWGWFADCCR